MKILISIIFLILINIVNSNPNISFEAVQVENNGYDGISMGIEIKVMEQGQGDYLYSLGNHFIGDVKSLIYIGISTKDNGTAVFSTMDKESITNSPNCIKTLSDGTMCTKKFNFQYELTNNMTIERVGHDDSQQFYQGYVSFKNKESVIEKVVVGEFSVPLKRKCLDSNSVFIDKYFSESESHCKTYSKYFIDPPQYSFQGVWIPHQKVTSIDIRETNSKCRDKDQIYKPNSQVMKIEYNKEIFYLIENGMLSNK
ncbi:hypothetical protein CYY_000137 [Polysphondylium violaceum]|uniref:DOMON domain-containing protein n=1 Tax=Polysphondylium violaceum TaxID=133409 RepID=A0A8J4V985_9MYCE|nr:hypothetical protein CYY_000137 [Polysphondylium violaceum]